MILCQMNAYISPYFSFTLRCKDQFLVISLPHINAKNNPLYFTIIDYSNYPFYTMYIKWGNVSPFSELTESSFSRNPKAVNLLYFHESALSLEISWPAFIIDWNLGKKAMGADLLIDQTTFFCPFFCFMFVFFLSFLFYFFFLFLFFNEPIDLVLGVICMY